MSASELIEPIETTEPVTEPAEQVGIQSIPTQTEPAEPVVEKKSKRDYAIELYNRFKENPLLWYYYYFPHHMDRESPPFHLEMIRESMKSRLLAVASPRESAKSEILTFVKPFHAITFKLSHFIVIVENTFKKAAKYLDIIKTEMAENKEYRSNFLGITLTKDAEGDSIIRHPDGFDTRILCKGVDQIGSLRGERHRHFRPDLIIGDDMEDDELVRSPDRRQQLQNDFDNALIPCGTFGKTQYIFVGTVLHDDSLMAKLVSKDHYEHFTKLFYRARYEKDGEKHSLWPEKWTVADLDRMEKEKPSTFAKEYQNNPVSGLMARFKREDFRYWSSEGNRFILTGQNSEILKVGNLSDCRAAIACDLAWKEKRENDASVILWGFLTPNSDILIEGYVHKKGMRPNEIIDQLFSLEEKLRSITKSTVPIGFEKAMLENVTQWILRNTMRERNKFLVTKELVWDADKQTRIETRLEPRYSQHTIFHKRDMGDLEAQLERFPSAAHDDLPDAEQGLVQLLQNPKSHGKSVEQESEFDLVRRMHIESKTLQRSEQRYNPVSKHSNFPFQVTKSWQKLASNR